MFRKKDNPRGRKGDLDPLLVNFQVAALIGGWEINSKVAWKKNLYAVYRFINLSLYTIIPILEIVDIFGILDDVEKLNYNLCSSGGTVMLIFKLIILMSNRKTVIRLQKTLQDNFGMSWVGQTKEDRTILKNSNDFIVKLNKMLYAIVVFTVTLWALIPMIDTAEPGEVVTPLRMWFPFDQGKTPNYQLVYSLEVYMLYLYAGSIITIDLIFFGFLPKFCAHFDILMGNLKNIGRRYEDKEGEKPPREAEQKTYRYLQNSIRHHHAIIKAISEFEDIYSKIVIIHFTGMATLMCVEVYDIAMVPRSTITIRLMTQLNYLVSSLVDTFLFCLNGQKLINKSDELSMTLYSVPWWNMSLRCQKLLLQMNVATKKPPTMTGGRHFPVNLATFLSILQLSYQILAMLEQMK